MPINRLFLALLLATLFFAALVGFGVMRQSDNTPPPLVLFLPDYAAQLSQGKSLSITYGLGLSGTRALHIVKSKQDWRLGDIKGYRANQELVQETLVALAHLQKIAPQSGDDLGLTAPEDLGQATRLQIVNEAGDIMVSVLLGRKEESDNFSQKKTSRFGRTQERFYMFNEQKPAQGKWLVQGRLPRNYRLEAWLDPYLPHHIIAASPATLASVRFQDKTLSAAYYKALRQLRPDHVAAAETIGFPKEGLTLAIAYNMSPDIPAINEQIIITYHIKTTTAHIWVKPHIQAKSSGKNPVSAPTQALARQLQSRYGGWALRFAADTARLWLPYN
ncbi:MAG: hypothetical protein HAW64_05845 [Alphaproteobacteria bacterium]|nr:hypothetical protein [Alphaproteobacteria bacterium]